MERSFDINFSSNYILGPGKFIKVHLYFVSQKVSQKDLAFQLVHWNINVFLVQGFV